MPVNKKEPEAPKRRRYGGKSQALVAAEAGRESAERKLKAARGKAGEVVKTVGNGMTAAAVGVAVAGLGSFIGNYVRPHLGGQAAQADALGRLAATLIGSKLVKGRNMKLAIQAAGMGTTGAAVDVEALMTSVKGVFDKNAAPAPLPTPPGQANVMYRPIPMPPAAQAAPVVNPNRVAAGGGVVLDVNS